MKTEGNIAMLILAAGESKRMNDIKQLLPWKKTNHLLDYGSKRIDACILI